MLDCHLFIVPQGGRTWLEDIHVTAPEEQIKYSVRDNNVEILKKKCCWELASISAKNKRDIESIGESYCRHSNYCNETLFEYPVSISLSYGSDSRAVLALIRKRLPKLTAYTFGDNEIDSLLRGLLEL
jgi:hypothetical protein